MNKKLKVLRVIESFYPVVSGSANQALQISKETSNKGIKNVVFTTFHKAQNCDSADMIDKVEVNRFHTSFSFMKYFYTPEMKSNIRWEMPDIIYAHNYRSYQTQIAYQVAKDLNIPFILQPHGSVLGYKRITQGINQLPYKVYDLFGSEIVKKASQIVVSSEEEKDELHKFGRKSGINKIPMGIDVDYYNKFPKKKDDGTIRLLFVGRICKDRNVMALLKAMRYLDNDKFRLTVVGGEEKRSDTDKEGYYKQLLEYAEWYGISVHFTGPLYGDDLAKQYSNADIFVYPTLWENFGQTVLEAGASGLPVIATATGVAPELIDDYINGYALILLEPKHIADRIKELATLKRYKKMGKKMQQDVKNNYSWEKIAQQHIDLYKYVKNKNIVPKKF